MTLRRVPLLTVILPTVTVADAGNTGKSCFRPCWHNSISHSNEVTGNGDSTTGVADDAATISAIGEVNLKLKLMGQTPIRLRILL